MFTQWFSNHPMKAHFGWHQRSMNQSAKTRSWKERWQQEILRNLADWIISNKRNLNKRNCQRTAKNSTRQWPTYQRNICKGHARIGGQGKGSSSSSMGMQMGQWKQLGTIHNYRERRCIQCLEEGYKFKSLDGELWGPWGRRITSAIDGMKNGSLCELAGERIKRSWGCAKNYYQNINLMRKKGKENFQAALMTCLSREVLTT